MPLDGHVEEFGHTLGEELLKPTRIYAKDCLALAEAGLVHAFSHVTGGGLTANLQRVLPDGLVPRIDLQSWTPDPVFDLIATRGGVAPEEMERTFNLGVGMVAVVPAEAADDSVALLAGRGVDAWVLGELTTLSR
jgi:phosphoribosylformylglycinamidine cyclo-ligase